MKNYLKVIRFLLITQIEHVNTSNKVSVWRCFSESFALIELFHQLCYLKLDFEVIGVGLELARIDRLQVRLALLRLAQSLMGPKLSLAEFVEMLCRLQARGIPENEWNWRGLRQKNGLFANWCSRILNKLYADSECLY